MTGTIRSRLALLESTTIEATPDGSATQASIRWCLESSGLDPDNMPPLTDEEKAWAKEVLEAAAQTVGKPVGQGRA